MHELEGVLELGVLVLLRGDVRRATVLLLAIVALALAPEVAPQIGFALHIFGRLVHVFGKFLLDHRVRLDALRLNGSPRRRSSEPLSALARRWNRAG